MATSSIIPPRLEEELDLVDDLGEVLQHILRPKAKHRVAHVVRSEPDVLCSEGFAEYPLGLGVLAFDLGHHAATLR